MKPSKVMILLRLIYAAILVFTVAFITILRDELGRDSISLIILLVVIEFLFMLRENIIKGIFESHIGMKFKELMDILRTKGINLF